MIELKEKQQLPFEYNWQLKAYLPGTVKLGEPREYRSPDGSQVFRGRDIIPTRPPEVTLEGENLIMAVGKAQVGDMLIDVATYDTGFTYCALGDDDTAPAEDQIKLVDEGGTGPGGAAMRLAITYKARLANVITLSTFFTAAQCTLAILEAAIFGHDANAVKDSGIIWSRWLVSFDNSGALYDITISYILTIG